MATVNGWNNNILSSNSTIILNAGTNGIQIGTDVANSSVDIGTGAAAKVVTLGSTTGASSLALKTGTADFSLASNTGNIIVAQDTGEVTMPLQPAFLAYLSANANNVTGDGTLYSIVWNAEIFDQNADFDTGTGIFTAPVTGRYQFNISIAFQDLAAANNAGVISLVTSNRTYLLMNGNCGILINSGQWTVTSSVFADMDVGDTAYVSTAIYGGTKIVDIISAGATDPRSWFSGYLVC